jgi:hypothetical protein
MDAESKNLHLKESSSAKLILLDGLIINGGLFAVLMTVANFFLEWYHSGQAINEYLIASKTWYTFLYYFLFFGLFIGISNWVKSKGKKVERYKITGS